MRRSIPAVFDSLGKLVTLLRWGLPPSEPIAHDPFPEAMRDGYLTTLERLRQSFVGPEPIEVPDPGRLRGGEGRGVEPFERLVGRARTAAGLPPGTLGEEAEERYREWFAFAYLQRVVLERVAAALGYDAPDGDVMP